MSDLLEKLDSSTVQGWLEQQPAWRHDAVRGAITREFVFADFTQAFAFMTQLALLAQTRNHHPEWFNVYNRVTLTWTTHDVDGLSRLDLDMAQMADQAFARFATAK
ncbi:MAG: 4a-hydroxytetrahydrobiopterin dehydratase [Lysobacterales bacterium]